VNAFHSTAFALPRRARNVRYLLTVHDVTLLKFPHGYSRRQRLVSQRIIASAERADMILPNSATTAADLQEYVRVDPARVRVIYPMLDDRLAPGNAEKPLAALPSEYLLYAGGADRTKNLETLLQAVARLKVPLLVVGMIVAARSAELLAALPAPDRGLVSFLGHVPDSRLAWLYGHAAAFVFPGLNEGFGYPPLEALQCGTPAVVARAGALPEILQNAALYVDKPLDAEEWTTTIGRLLQDAELKKKLLADGKALLPRYSAAAFKKNLSAAYFATT
jgi:glycosyltransferase involved in cell wall biosynthesis